MYYKTKKEKKKSSFLFINLLRKSTDLQKQDCSKFYLHRVIIFWQNYGICFIFAYLGYSPISWEDIKGKVRIFVLLVTTLIK